MTTPNSLPQERPQPDQARYALSELSLFTMYDRASYKLAFGEDPPTYDPSKPTKSWFDTSGGSSYNYYDGSMKRVSFTLSPADAATLNVWGVRPYPTYAPAPTKATRSGIPMPPTILSTKEQADGLAAAWNVPPVRETTVNFSNDTYPPDETRRPWALVIGTSDFYVGEQIAIQNANGMGAPGRWDLSGSVPQWVSDLPPAPTTQNPEGPVPMRELKDNERLISGGMMDSAIYVERIDLGAMPTTPVTLAGGLTEAQDQRLQRIEGRVNAIAQRFGIL